MKGSVSMGDALLGSRRLVKVCKMATWDQRGCLGYMFPVADPRLFLNTICATFFET